jgi:hypothetical protein
MWGFGGMFGAIGLRLLLTRGRTSMFAVYNVGVGGFIVTSALRW